MIINSFTGQFRFLSNFYPCRIYYEDIAYPSVEHAYQAAKSWDEKDKLFIVDCCPTSGDAKRAGKTFFLREDWEEIKLDIMEYLLNIKFSKNWAKEKLIATHPHELIEGNYWHDNFWGTCYCYKCNNKGLNQLGNLLMKMRQELLDTSSNKTT